MNTEILQQFADENGLEFECSINRKLSGALSLSFYQLSSCHAYTYYVGLWELQHEEHHEAVIRDVIQKVKTNLLKR